MNTFSLGSFALALALLSTSVAHVFNHISNPDKSSVDQSFRIQGFNDIAQLDFSVTCSSHDCARKCCEQYPSGYAVGGEIYKSLAACIWECPDINDGRQDDSIFITTTTLQEASTTATSLKSSIATPATATSPTSGCAIATTVVTSNGDDNRFFRWELIVVGLVLFLGSFLMDDTSLRDIIDMVKHYFFPPAPGPE